MNAVLLDGILGRDPESRTVARGTLLVRASLAVRREGRDTDPDWIPVVAFGREAEVLSAARKGDRVVVSGRVSARSWKAQDGSPRKSVEIVASTVAVQGRGITVEPTAEPTSDPIGDDAMYWA